MKVRPATLSDHAGIMRFYERNGISIRSEESWRSIWTSNPCSEEFADVPIGWVLVDEQGDVVGAYGNVPMRFYFEGKPLRTAIGTAWAVDRSVRGHSLTLAAQYFNQRNMDLLVETTISPAAAQVVPGFRMCPLPMEGYTRAMLWPVRPFEFTKGALRALNIPAAGIIGGLVGAGVAIRQALVRSPRVPGTLRVTQGFDGFFDEIWSGLLRQPGRLLVDRSREALTWRFREMISSQRVVIVTYEENDIPSGYMIMYRRDRPRYGVKRLFLADLQVLPGLEGRIPGILAEGLRYARAEGVHVVESYGLRAEKRQTLESTAPLRRTLLKTSPYYYKALQAPLRQALTSASVWDPCPLDGDEIL